MFFKLFILIRIGFHTCIFLFHTFVRLCLQTYLFILIIIGIFNSNCGCRKPFSLSGILVFIFNSYCGCRVTFSISGLLVVFGTPSSSRSNITFIANLMLNQAFIIFNLLGSCLGKSFPVLNKSLSYWLVIIIVSKNNN